MEKIKNKVLFLGWCFLFLGLVVLTLAYGSTLYHYLQEEHAKVREKSVAMAVSFHKPPNYDLIIQYIKQDGDIQSAKEGYNSFGAFYDYYSLMAEHIPENPRLWFVLGVLEYLVDKNRAAEVSLIRALELDKYYFWAYHNLAVLYWDNNDCGEGFQEVIKRAQYLTQEAVNVSVKRSVVLEFFWRDIPNIQHVLNRHYKMGLKNIQKMEQTCGQSAVHPSIKMFFF